MLLDRLLDGDNIREILLESDFNDGDTPNKLDVNKKYKVTRISLDGNKDSDFGVLTGAELKSVLKGFRTDTKYL